VFIFEPCCPAHIALHTVLFVLVILSKQMNEWTFKCSRVVVEPTLVTCCFCERFCELQSNIYSVHWLAHCLTQLIKLINQFVSLVMTEGWCYCSVRWPSSTHNIWCHWLQLCHVSYSSSSRQSELYIKLAVFLSDHRILSFKICAHF